MEPTPVRISSVEEVTIKAQTEGEEDRRLLKVRLLGDSMETVFMAPMEQAHEFVVGEMLAIALGRMPAPEGAHGLRVIDVEDEA